MPSSCASEGPVRGPSSLLEGGQRHRSGAPGLTRGCGSVPPFPPFSPLFLPELRSPSGPPSVETPDTLPSSPGSPTQDRDTQPADPGPVTTGLRRPRTPTASLSGVPPALTARPRVSARAHPSLGRGGVRPHGLGVPSDLGGWWASRRCLSELGCKAAHAANCPCARRLGPRPTAAPPAGALSAEGIVGPSSSSVTAAPRACEGSSRNPPCASVPSTWPPTSCDPCGPSGDVDVERFERGRSSRSRKGTASRPTRTARRGWERRRPGERPRAQRGPGRSRAGQGGPPGGASAELPWREEGALAREVGAGRLPQGCPRLCSLEPAAGRLRASVPPAEKQPGPDFRAPRPRTARRPMLTPPASPRAGAGPAGSERVVGGRPLPTMSFAGRSAGRRLDSSDRTLGTCSHGNFSAAPTSSGGAVAVALPDHTADGGRGGGWGVLLTQNQPARR